MAPKGILMNYESLHLGHEDAPDVLLVSALHGTGVAEASSMLLTLE